MSQPGIKIELLYFDGCPNRRIALERLREVLREENVAAEVVEVNVPDEAAARAAGFLGSPTIRINGLDVEPSARSSRDFGMMCRTYAVGSSRQVAPPKELIRAALREALGAQQSHHACCPPDSGSSGQRRANASRPGLFVAASIVAAALASFCCILPVVFALTGLAVAGASATFAAWRPYLLALTFGLLSLGFYFAYRRPESECAPGSVCAIPASRRRVRIILWLGAAAVIVLAAFPSFSGRVAEFLLSSAAAGR
jgi:hypothetical protein